MKKSTEAVPKRRRRATAAKKETTKKPSPKRKTLVAEEPDEAPAVTKSLTEFFEEVGEDGRVFTHAEIRELKKEMKEAGHKREDIALVAETANKVLKVDRDSLEALTERLAKENADDAPFATIDIKNNVFEEKGARKNKKLTTGQAYLKLCRTTMDGKQYIAAMNHYLSDGEMSLTNYREQLFETEEMEKMIAKSGEPAPKMFANIGNFYHVLRPEFMVHDLPKGLKVDDDVNLKFIGAYPDRIAKVKGVCPLSVSFYRGKKEDGTPIPYAKEREELLDATYIEGIEIYTPEPVES